MAEEYFDRYKDFKVDGQVKPVPFIKINEKPTDEYIILDEVTRFDILSQRYYNNGTHGFLILQANPELGGLSDNIPKGTRIRIPLPFKQTIQEYNDKVKEHIKYYGL